MGSQQGGGSGITDQTSNFMWLIGLFFGIAVVVWFVASKYIVIPVFWVRLLQIEFLYGLESMWGAIAQFLHMTPPDYHDLQALETYLTTVDPSTVDWRKFASINKEVGEWTRFPVIFVLLGLSAVAWSRTGAQFRNSYSMKQLREVGKEAWPQIAPVLSLDLIKADIDKGPWAMARPTLSFCRENDLLSVKVVAYKKVWVLKQRPSYRLFALQVGPLWMGLEALPIHLKMLVLVFLARATGQRDIARRFLSQVSASAASGKLDFTDVSEQLKSFYGHRIIRWAEKRHAYVTGVLATLLEIARSDGVLASAEFLWLKPVDRRMWFMLNSVGRQTAVVEVSGAFSHWIAEKKLERAIKTPIVKGAVDALDEALQSILYVEESEQWRTISAD
ncbi:MAG: hypothetical protein A3J38_06170 [Gammaproteobacteria bacterium RIFCSPHIGHO2_12_FULL_45_9]|nr:MAG: hypothetical protein A3J38_06170 [Gammaproteobacteria bacterium RIFCSPHIGHO2_12_FULL_45_9]